MRLMYARKILALALAALLLATLWAWCAAEADIPALPGETEQIGMDGLDTDAAFEDYVNRLFGIGQRPGLLRALSVRILGAGLSDLDRAVYDSLKAQIAQVAAGERASTVFEVTAAELGLDGKYYAEDLGVESVVSDGKIAADAAEAMWAQGRCDFSTIFRVLLRDCPYEMYWCDKTLKTNSKGFGIGGKRDADRGEYYLYFTGNMAFSFPVAVAYSAGADYTVDTGIARTAAAAAENALTVVGGAPSEDVEKLWYYKEWICESVSYNSAAAAGGVSYGNPWQLIWVFDGDSETNVVCEGYAKAFQYLCSKSDFSSDIDSRIATGKMNDENHMWNIVEMPNGKNYMVDVTNCDGSSIGAPDKLFLVGTHTGSVDDGYTFALGKGVKYTYDEATHSVYDDGDLTLWAVSYYEEPEDRLVLPEGVAAIQDEAFAGTAVECVVIPQSCATIGTRAFAGCGALVEVWIPAGIPAAAIADDAFAGSENALIVTDDANIRAWAVDHGMLWCPEY